MRIIRSFGSVANIPSKPNLRRAYGVPDSGPTDVLSYKIALALGADPEQVVEVTGGGLEIAVEAPTWFVAIGAEGETVVDGEIRPHRNGRFLVQKSLLVAAPLRGWVTYLAPATRSGDLSLGHPSSVDEAGPLRISPSPDGHSQADLIACEWTISLDSDRRGTRLNGAKLSASEQGPSEMAVPGLVQLPPGGAPIILGPAGPTVGGYAKLGVLIAPDQSALAQKSPGTVVSFSSVTWEEAEQVESAFEAALNETAARLSWL